MTLNRLDSISAAMQSNTSSAMKTGYNRVLPDNRGSHNLRASGAGDSCKGLRAASRTAGRALEQPWGLGRI
ncbi:hypothetical protein BIFADO_01892 [Bifidobacterium adolescentis L2-32]|uniref:Uncharacterized protein n=1 Tax=Bifidobacterium adolescentis L2-32 TaxID=411481 RepID=A7A7Q2_BIFAD|nr:hypothetical protein BIFADO_01892 [Bifidobacterium adolescentis L2-32]